MKIHFIAAALPPALDGIGDYSALLAAELAKTASVKVMTAQPEPAAIPGAPVETVFSAADPRSTWNIVRHIEADPPDWVLLQYNPFSYGRWGLNLHLPLVMLQIKRRCPDVRVAIMAHEIYVPFGVTWQFRVMTLWQRPQFAALSRIADALFFSIDAWAQTYAKKFPGKPVVHLPVGSNIPLVPISRSEARARLGIPEGACVLGVFGAMHTSRMMDWIVNAAQAVCAAGQEVLVLYIGPDGDAVRALLGSVPLIADGPFPADEVSRRFAAMDIHLTPFVDGVSTRRGSLMTGLQHGIATVGTTGHHTDSLLYEQAAKALLLANVSQPDLFQDHVVYLASHHEERRQIGQAAQKFYEDEFSWQSISARLSSILNA